MLRLATLRQSWVSVGRWLATLMMGLTAASLVAQDRQEQLADHQIRVQEARAACLEADWQRALEQAAEAIALARQLFGEQSAELAEGYELWGDCAVSAERLDDARQTLQAAESLFVGKFTDKSHPVARVRGKLADLAKIEKLPPQERAAWQAAQKSIRQMQRDLAASEYLPETIVTPEPAAVESLSRILDRDSRAVLAACHLLSTACRTRGDYAQAVRYSQRAWKGKLHPHDPEGIQWTAAYAALLAETGDLARAAPLLADAVAREKEAGRASGEGHARLLNELAVVRETLGDYEAAAKLYEESYLLYRAVAGAEWRQDGELLDRNRGLSIDLARVASGDRAQRLFDEATQFQIAFGPGDDRRVLINLASNSLLAGRFAEAKVHLDKELQSKRDFEGAPPFPLIDAESATVRSAWNMLQGFLPQAEERAREALRLQREHRPAGHPRIKAALSNLALLCQLNGKQREADALARECLDLTLKSAALCSFVQSERQQLALADNSGRFLGTYLTVGGVQASSISNEEAYRQVLRWKGATSLRTFQRQIEQSIGGSPNGDEWRELAEKLAQAKRDLAVTYFRVPQDEYEDDYVPIRERAEELIADIDELEARLADRGVAKISTPPAAALDSLRELLGDDAVLVDIVEYRKFTPLAGSVFRFGRVPWLGAFVVHSQGEIVWIDLGQSQPINAAVEAWRVTFGGSGEVRGASRTNAPVGGQPAAGQALRTLVWNKLEPHLGNAKTVVISPAGSLARVSFAALPGQQPGTYLLEERAIAYAAAPQLLPELTMRPSRAPLEGGPQMLLIGDVDFGAEPGLPADAAASRMALRSATVDLANLPALPNTCPEVLTIGKLFEKQFPTGQATVLRGAEPTEEKIRTLTPDQLFLHFATHGFFGRMPRPAAAGQISPLSLNVGDERDAAGFHPSLLCGLTLAGARRPPAADRDDGVLTAFEVESLDVSNLELVALSACQTGLGQSAASDGLLGLQRAFQVGGTRTVVASLWPVDDASTRQLMTDFYQNLWQQGLPRAEALRQAQLALLQGGLRPESRVPIGADYPECVAAPADGQRALIAVEAPRPTGKRLAPFYWAPLVLSGAWK